MEEAIVETLRFPLFITGTFPFTDEYRRSGVHLVPRQAHVDVCLNQREYMVLALRIHGTFGQAFAEGLDSNQRISE